MMLQAWSAREWMMTFQECPGCLEKPVVWTAELLENRRRF